MRWFSKLRKSSSPPIERGSLVPEGVAVFAIGDIHGRLDLLERLMRRLVEEVRGLARVEVHFVFLGDYIDRGFSSKQVIDFLVKAEWGRVIPVFLKGNHEQVLLDFLERPDVGPRWIEYGGRETLSSYGISIPSDKSDVAAWGKTSEALSRAMPETHKAFLGSCRTWHEIGQCYFVHAGIDPTKPLSDQTDEDRLWIRDKFLFSPKKADMVIVHGHTPEDEPVWNGRRIGIDTGAYITNKLTAARIFGSHVEFIAV